jgi:hypothetical protein
MRPAIISASSARESALVVPPPLVSIMAPTIVSGTNRSSVVHEKNRPIEIRFFHRIAISSAPSDARRNGVTTVGREGRSARMPSLRARASFSDSSADASSNGTSIRSTHA